MNVPAILSVTAAVIGLMSAGLTANYDDLAAKVTLGPSGRNVILDKKFGSPTITKDGVTVAKEIELEEPYVARVRPRLCDGGSNAPLVEDKLRRYLAKFSRAD